MSDTTTNHTPGPWKALKGNQDDPERWGVCQNIDGEPNWLIATVENGAPGDKMKTEGINAQLIAAAPELLEACKAWLDLMYQTGKTHHELYWGEVLKTREAIAKALGSTGEER